MSHRHSLRAGLVAAALAAAGLSVPATEADAQGRISPKVRKACAGDYKKLCPTYKVGSPQLRACMEAKQSQLSWGCVSALIDSGEVSRSARR